MSKWQGKYVIGLTGNIGTGKSVVRRMMEHLGAYGIDADTLGHRAIARGAPGYSPVVSTFGRFVLTPEGEIDRSKLARLVFSDPQALAYLERIVHPLVEQAIDLIIQRASQKVIVIEAIKLLETNIHKNCDSIWVTYAPPEIQMARLIQNRKMGENEARQRITAQPPQERKLAAANVVIRNTSTFEDTWRQVAIAWQKFVPSTEAALQSTRFTPVASPGGEVTVMRGKPRQSNEIAEIINRVAKPVPPLRKDDIMAAFGDKAFLVLQVGQTLMGVIAWQVENLVARTTEIVIDPAIPLNQALPALVTEMERASRELQCEASLIFVTPALAQNQSLWKSLGYEQRSPQSLGILAWQEAAQDSMPAGTTLFFKQLRTDRILRPI